LCFTDGQAGRAGTVDGPALATRAQLGEVRRQELRDAARVLNIGEVITPGWPDGGLRDIPDEEGVAFLTRELRRLRPDVVITFGPEGGGNAHGDHMACCRWTLRAWDRAGSEEGEGAPHTPDKLYWVTWRHDADHLRGVSATVVTCTLEFAESIQRAKYQAFAAHRTQQDHAAVHDELLRLYGPREYYHLARTRVDSMPIQENDLLTKP
jgi:LmbE family N-acetylglucosaminyl deacetylase